VSVEHLFLALARRGPAARVKKYFASFNLDRAKVLKELQKMRATSA